MTPRFDPSKKKGGAKACCFQRSGRDIQLLFEFLPLDFYQEMDHYGFPNSQAAAKAGTKRPGAPAGGAAKRGKKLLGWKKRW